MSPKPTRAWPISRLQSRPSKIFTRSASAKRCSKANALRKATYGMLGQIAELLAAQQAKAEKEAEAKKKQEAIAAAEKVAAEAEAKLAALKAELSIE